MIDDRLTFVVLLYLHDGRHDDFEDFEARAFAIMARHGGRLEQRVRCAPPDASVPDEVHIVSFPDQASFDRYRADDAVKDLADLRARVIRHTVLWPGRALPPF